MYIPSCCYLFNSWWILFFQLLRAETFQKRSHPGNGFHSQAYTMTQDLWEDHCGADFILAKNMVWRMDVSTSTSDVAQKTKIPRQVLGCLKKLVYDWLLQRVTASLIGVAHLWIWENIELTNHTPWGARPPITVSTRKLTKNVEVCQPLLRSSPISLPSWGQRHAFCEAAPGDFTATMDAGKKKHPSAQRDKVRVDVGVESDARQDVIASKICFFSWMDFSQQNDQSRRP